MRAWTSPLDQLRRPHLVLADVGDDAIAAAFVERCIQCSIDIVRHQLRGLRAAQIRLAVLVRSLTVSNVLEPNESIARRGFFD